MRIAADIIHPYARAAAGKGVVGRLQHLLPVDILRDDIADNRRLEYIAVMNSGAAAQMGKRRKIAQRAVPAHDIEILIAVAADAVLNLVTGDAMRQDCGA